jgi:phthiocerol/phenolphthiocerol synthesis type-I polyketide synthase E
MKDDSIAIDARAPTTLLLSAETPTDLDAATAKLAAWMTKQCASGRVGWPLPEVAAALRDRCKPFAHRRAVHVESWQDALPALADKTRHATAAAVTGTPKLFLSFPGQGSLRPGLLARLHTSEPRWAQHLDRFSQLAYSISGFDCAAWFGDAQADADSVLKDNAKTQLAIFCVGTSLGRWLLDLGLRPDGFVGHSLGEWMGANLASVLSDEEAIRAVHHRGRLMQATGPGAALIVKETPDALAAHLSPDVALACVNAPNLCLLSGRPKAIAACAEKLAAARVFCRPAPIHVAVHSSVMEDVVEPFSRELHHLAFHAPRTRLLSTVTGTWMTEAEARDPGYWAWQLRRPVRFDKAAATLLAEPSAVVLEVGMGSALTSLFSSQARNQPSHRALALFGRDEPPAEGYDASHVHKTLGELWASGVTVDLVGDVKLTRPAPKLPD